MTDLQYSPSFGQLPFNRRAGSIRVHPAPAWTACRRKRAASPQGAVERVRRWCRRIDSWPEAWLRPTRNPHSLASIQTSGPLLGQAKRESARSPWIPPAAQTGGCSSTLNDQGQTKSRAGRYVRPTRAEAQLQPCPRCFARVGEACQGRRGARAGNHLERRHV